MSAVDRVEACVLSAEKRGRGMRQPVPETPKGSDRPIGQQPLSSVGFPESLHPSWSALIRLCREIHHGEIERLVIQDGLPVLAEVARKKVRLL